MTLPLKIRGIQCCYFVQSLFQWGKVQKLCSKFKGAWIQDTETFTYSGSQKWENGRIFVFYSNSNMHRFIVK